MPNTIDRLKSALADRYEIEREIGSGGMATVYLAVDLKHHRKVAVKVLRPEISAALGSKRFLREVEIAAGLTHPHVLPLHDSGESDGFLYFVMPYIEGESLREKLVKEGSLPIQEAVKIFKEVVDALAHAHSKSVVHRDIKPDNVMLSGRHAMVTDFGVAKAVSEATGRQSLTTAGVALGTPAYMAPEQATADPNTDHRADIYAVGVLAYEMLTGSPPFSGTTPQQILSAHVTETPEPVTKRREKVPGALEAVVMKCLEKIPADRWQTAEEMLPHLETISTPSGGLTPTATQPITAVGRPSSKVPLIAGAALGAVALGVIGFQLFKPSPVVVTTSNHRQITRATITQVDPQLSPMGGELVYTEGNPGSFHLYLMNVEGGRAVALTAGMSGEQRYPFWSPDGNSIAFSSFSASGLGGGFTPSTVVIPKLGGTGRTLRVDGIAWAWSPDGERIAYASGDTIFTRAVSGAALGVVEVALDVLAPHSLSWSPDGSKIAFVSGNERFISSFLFGNVAPSAIMVVDAAGGEPVSVTDNASMHLSPVWMPDSRTLLFVSDRDGSRDIFSVPLAGSGEPTADATRITTGLDAYNISVSGDGRLATYAKFRLKRNIWKLDVSSHAVAYLSDATPVTTGNQLIEAAVPSPDGRWLAYDSDIEGNQDIYIMPIEGGEPVRITTDRGDDFVNGWSPDGRWLTFHSNRAGNRDAFVISSDGNELVQLTDTPTHERFPLISPDGSHLAFLSGGLGGLSSAVHLTSWDNAAGAFTDTRELVPGDVGAVLFSWSPESDFRLLDLRTGATRTVIVFDDPSFAPLSLEFSNNVAYITLGEFESDVYTMEITVD